jgi:hypothetical protein
VRLFLHQWVCVRIHLHVPLRADDTYAYSKTFPDSKRYRATKASADSAAAAVTGDDELVERVVLRKGVWLPRSFTLNALGDITAASPPDIRAFGDYLSSSSEKPTHLLLIEASQDFS